MFWGGGYHILQPLVERERFVWLSVTGRVRWSPLLACYVLRYVFTFWQQLPLALSLRLGSQGHYLAELSPFSLVSGEALQQSLACSSITAEQERREEDSQSHTGCIF